MLERMLFVAIIISCFLGVSLLACLLRSIICELRMMNEWLNHIANGQEKLPVWQIVACPHCVAQEKEEE